MRKLLWVTIVLSGPALGKLIRVRMLVLRANFWKLGVRMEIINKLENQRGN